MATSAYLVSTVVMGVLFVSVALAVARGRDWRRYSSEREAPPGVTSRLANDGTAWIVGFVLLVAAAIGATLVAAGGGGTTLVVAGGGAAAIAFLTVGIYSAAKSRGHPHSHAVGEAIITLGAVSLVAIVGWLLLTAGA